VAPLTDQRPGIHEARGAAPGRRPTRVWQLVCLAAAVALAGVVAYGVTRSPPSRPPVAKLPTGPPPLLAPGTPAPGFSLPRLGGGPPVVLASYRGTPVILNFFASWCPHCQPELAPLAALARAQAGRVAVVGVDSNDLHPAQAAHALDAAGAAYPVAVDAKAQLAAQYLLTVLPVTYFLDAGGRVVGSATGPQGTAALARWVARLTPAAPAP